MKEQLKQQAEIIRQQQSVLEVLAPATPDGPTPIASRLNDIAAGSPLRPSFADAVKKSVQTALQEERSKCDVIITKVEENGQDEIFVENLCSKITCDAKPTSVSRLGRKTETASHHRLLKVTFSTNFDARAFRSRFEEMKKLRSDEEFSAYRIRPGRSQEEQAAFRRYSAIANRLNKEAKEAGETCSFSVRDNGCIWKFERQPNGKWVHVSDWQLEDLGNDGGSPKPQARIKS